ncbi:MAG: hypothetical protein M3Q69_07295 [Acidobacteriota bacterium]|nr:hypothetical protein [Acidobacteriota bacterium]
MQERTSSRYARIGLQAAFLAVFAALIYSNFALRRENAQLRAIARDNRTKQAMKVGERFPAFLARDSAGKSVTLPQQLRRDLRFVIVDPGCPRCEVVLSRMREKQPSDVVVVSLRPRALSSKIVAAVANAAPLYFVDRMAPQVLQSRLDVVPRVVSVAADGTIRQVCHDIDECKPPTEACDSCSANLR